MKLLDIVSTEWAIRPDKLKEMQSIYDVHMRGERIAFDKIEAILDMDSSGRDGYEIAGSIAIINITGVLVKRSGLFDRFFYGSGSMEHMGADFQKALIDPGVDAILFYMDTPGGTVDGTQEFASAIYEARGTKPIYVFSDGQIDSAGYWIASAADKIFISGDTAEVGSIGVVATHTDYSEQDKKYGVTITEIVAGKYKRIASQNQPLSDEGKDYIQSQVDYVYSVFVNDVARNRGVSAEDVIENMADGRIFIGKQSIKAGLVDGVSTKEKLIEYMNENSLEILYEASRGDDSKEINLKENTMDAKFIQEKHPDVYEEIKLQGKEDARKDIEANAGKAQVTGAESERKRIQDVREQLIPGNEDLIEKLMFDGSTTGEQAAVKVLHAEKERLKARADELNTDGIDAMEHDNAPGDETPPKEPKGTFEEQVKAAWDKDEKLRTEFGENFDRYKAFCKNDKEGRARIYGGKR